MWRFAGLCRTSWTAFTRNQTERNLPAWCAIRWPFTAQCCPACCPTLLQEFYCLFFHPCSHLLLEKMDSLCPGTCSTFATLPTRAFCLRGDSTTSSAFSSFISCLSSPQCKLLTPFVHDIKELSLHTQQGDDSELIDVPGIFLVRDPNSLHTPPLGSDLKRGAMLRDKV